jgi:hypothetical protein
MSRKAVVCGWLFSGIASLITTSESVAQWVDVSPGGGVHVRAPFVRVDVFPYGGGVSVRAPFAAVDVPGRPQYYGPPPIVVERQVAEPTFSTPQELADLDDATLRRILRTNAARLYERLGRFDTGATWQRYLRLRSDDFDGSLSDERREALSTLLERFRSVASDPQYAVIAELPNFAAMQSVLTEMVFRIDQSSAAIGAGTEELPAPSQPVQPTGKRPFMQPK